MHNALPLVLALTFAGTQMQAQAPGIGDTFAGFPVLVEGKQVPFERFVGDIPVAIFLWDAPLKASSCSELAKAATKLAGERVRLHLARTDRKTLPRNSENLPGSSVRDRAALGRERSHDDRRHDGGHPSDSASRRQ